MLGTSGQAGSGDFPVSVFKSNYQELDERQQVSGRTVDPWMMEWVGGWLAGWVDEWMAGWVGR